MSGDDLARAAAKELAQEFGADLPNKTEAALRGEKGRSWVLGPEVAVLVVHCAHLAYEIYKDVKEKSAVRETLVAKIEVPKGISQASADRVINTIIEKL